MALNMMLGYSALKLKCNFRDSSSSVWMVLIRFILLLALGVSGGGVSQSARRSRSGIV